MRSVVYGCAAMLIAVWPAPGQAQEPDPAEAYGIYRPPPPPADSAPPAATPGATPAATSAPRAEPADTGAPDTLARVIDVPAALAADSAARASGSPSAATPGSPLPAAPQGSPRPDSVPAAAAASQAPLERTELPASDTSLTARMDVSRGGGLLREEFPDLRETARVTGRYAVFLELMERSGLASAFTDTTALTLLAPTDSAFARLPPAALEQLRGDSAARARWAASLVLEGDRTMAELLHVGEVPTLGGPSVRFTRGAEGTPLAQGAQVVQPDLIARNGRLHGVDRVTLPAPDTSATSAAP